MTNDELLAKLLENSLTETEHRELSARMAASPQFAEEVREYLAVEEVLKRTRSSLQPTPPLPLIDTIENSVAASIATVAGNAAVSGKSSLYSWLIAGLSAILVGGALWYVLPGSEQPGQNGTEQQIALEQPAAHVPVPPTPHNTVNPPQNDVASTPSLQQEPTVTTVQPSENAVQQNELNHTQQPATDDAKQSMDATSRDQEDKVRKELAKSRSYYEKYRAAGDVVNTMLAATQVGIFQRTLKDFESSRAFLDEALALARQLKLEENEAVITGQIGLLEKERGWERQAVKLIEECVQKLQALNSPELQRWQDELKALQSK